MEQNNTAGFYAYAKEKGIATSVTEQDSVSFVTAENFYQQGQYDNAFRAADQYIAQFPKGAYLLKINFYGYTSLDKLGRSGDTKPYLEYIIAQPDNDYTDNALLKLAGMEKSDGAFEKAKGYYERVLSITENQKTKMLALEGLADCCYKMRDYNGAIERSEQLSAMPDIGQARKNLVNYITGMSYFKKNNYSSALPKLLECSKKDRTERGAEAAYHVVLCNYKLGNLDETENRVFYISDNFGTYSYYVAMSFVTLSDVYVAKGNVFQAKATLKSIIDNYPGGEPKTLAEQRLAAIEKDESNNEEDE